MYLFWTKNTLNCVSIEGNLFAQINFCQIMAQQVFFSPDKGIVGFFLTSDITAKNCKKIKTLMDTNEPIEPPFIEENSDNDFMPNSKQLSPPPSASCKKRTYLPIEEIKDDVNLLKANKRTKAGKDTFNSHVNLKNFQVYHISHLNGAQNYSLMKDAQNFYLESNCFKLLIKKILP